MPTAASHVWRPSSARLLVLDGFVPVPRGTVATSPAPLSWPIKDPADILDYQLDVASALVGNDGDGIAALDVGIWPSEPGDLTLVSSSVDGSCVVLWFSRGQPGTTYTVRVAVTTAAGRVLSRNVLLPVLALAAQPVTANSILTGTGSALTDQNRNPLTTG